MNYLQFLRRLHTVLLPNLYVEIGVREGHSLAISRSPSIGIDPAFRITQELNAPVQLFKLTSDAFFDRGDVSNIISNQIDLGFIDGEHLFEFALRDFMNMEKWSGPGSVIVFDDIYPRTKEEALRKRQTNAWTGDIWKIIPVLQRYRPDLLLLRVDIAPTGLLLVMGCDRNNTALADNYEAIVAEFVPPADDLEPPEWILKRADALNAEQVLSSEAVRLAAEGKTTVASSALRSASDEDLESRYKPINPLSATAFKVVQTFDRLIDATEDAVFQLQPAANQLLSLPKLFVHDSNAVKYTGLGDVKEPDSWWGKAVTVPPLNTYKLRNAHIFAGRIVIRRAQIHEQGQLLLTRDWSLFSESYGQMDGSPTLPADLIDFSSDGTPSGVRLPAGPPKVLSGRHVFIGSLHRHFGHLLLEGLSRLWIAKYLAQFGSDFKFIIYESHIPEFAWTLLELAGIDKARVVHCDQHAVVEHLIVPAPSLRTHRWIRREQADTWATIASRIPRTYSSPEKVYLSRKRIAHRPLTNEDEVIKLFSSSGYAIIEPETLSVMDQLKLARGAKSIAGPVGSALYLAAFQRPGATNVVLAPRNFFLNDDLLIGSFGGTDLRLVFGTKIDYRKSKDVRSWSVDLDLVEQALSSN